MVWGFCVDIWLVGEGGVGDVCWGLGVVFIYNLIRFWVKVIGV